jgi:orotate phosphoribosyltransferase
MLIRYESKYISKKGYMAETVLDILKKVKAVLTNDHFVYTSGKHGSVYINKDAVYPHTGETSRIGAMFAEKYKDAGVEVVVAPAIGGTILSQWTAFHLSKLTRREVLSAYTEKDTAQSASAAESNQVLRRGYDKIVQGKNVLVIEDLTTTGISVKKVVASVKAAGGKVSAVCVMVNRDPVHVTSKTVGAPFSALSVLRADAVDEKDCRLCKMGVPVNITVGHGKKYRAKKDMP